ncbi:hypothetical protein BSZ37_12720 [Rubrivirga marina]|uniref:Transposase IS4-like domain-containing protein n=1 Tax=Rubrivirga marina TaxID=1196024 RepID=A0A271J2F4_9BACT|nr:hypothetical protein BSZ37_12720 [Rubrivirga marina]
MDRDGKGLSLAVHLTAGQRSESAQLEAVCDLVEVPGRPQRLLADRGYGAKRTRAWLRKLRIPAVIPERALAAGKKRRHRGRPGAQQGPVRASERGRALDRVAQGAPGPGDAV